MAKPDKRRRAVTPEVAEADVMAVVVGQHYLAELVRP
jgi:hypothetical protein